MKHEERRDARRVPIKVLVRCMPTGRGREGWEMWARDIADDGVGLRWSKGWASQKCPHWFDWLSSTDGSFSRTPCRCTEPPKGFSKGEKVRVNGLIYTEEGEKPIEGRIRWSRLRKDQKAYDVGILVTSPRHRSYFKALEQL